METRLWEESIMCGIIGCYVVKPFNNPYKMINTLMSTFKNQENRGIRGFGLYVQTPRFSERVRATTRDIFSFEHAKLWQKCNTKNAVFLFHHREPTSTTNNEFQNHPIANEKNDTFLIHNGIINNHSELYDRLSKEHVFETYKSWTRIENGEKEKEEVTYSDYNDSETILHLLEENKYNMKKTAEKLTGSFAVAYIKKGAQKIYLFKNSNPIIVWKDENGNIWFSSELPKTRTAEQKDIYTNQTGYIDGKGFKKMSDFISKVEFVNQRYNKYNQDYYDNGTWCNDGYKGYDGYGEQRYTPPVKVEPVTPATATKTTIQDDAAIEEAIENNKYYQQWCEYENLADASKDIKREVMKKSGVCEASGQGENEGVETKLVLLPNAKTTQELSFESFMEYVKEEEDRDIFDVDVLKKDCFACNGNNEDVKSISGFMYRYCKPCRQKLNLYNKNLKHKGDSLRKQKCITCLRKSRHNFFKGLTVYHFCRKHFEHYNDKMENQTRVVV